MLLYPCHRWKCVYIYKRMNLFGIQCKTSCVQCPITLGPVTVIHFQSPKERMATDDSDDPGDNDAEDAVLGLRKLWKIPDDRCAPQAPLWAEAVWQVQVEEGWYIPCLARQAGFGQGPIYIYDQLCNMHVPQHVEGDEPVTNSLLGNPLTL